MNAAPRKFDAPFPGLRPFERVTKLRCSTGEAVIWETCFAFCTNNMAWPLWVQVVAGNRPW